ncbi:MAG: hypothetical protein JXQ83_13450 [Candidatus Glassbacteria bacterium]|nr:hypothetical protein [Candidatus Glassbacteria bacterium]
MSNERRQLSIWFLVGIILAVYGLTIIGSGLYNMAHPPAQVRGAYLHLDLWWGLVLAAGGALLLWRQWPGKNSA